MDNTAHWTFSPLADVPSAPVWPAPGPLRLRRLRTTPGVLATELLSATRTLSGWVGRWFGRSPVTVEGQAVSQRELRRRLREAGCTPAQAARASAVTAADVARVLARAVRLPGIGSDLGRHAQLKMHWAAERLGPQLGLCGLCEVAHSVVGPRGAYRAAGHIELSLLIDEAGCLHVMEAGDRLRVWGGPGLLT